MKRILVNILLFLGMVGMLVPASVGAEDEFSISVKDFGGGKKASTGVFEIDDNLYMCLSVVGYEGEKYVMSLQIELISLKDNAGHARFRKWRENNLEEGFESEPVNVELEFEDLGKVYPRQAKLVETLIYNHRILLPMQNSPTYITNLEESLCGYPLKGIVVQGIRFDVSPERKTSGMFKKLFKELRKSLNIDRGKYASSGVYYDNLPDARYTYLESVREKLSTDAYHVLRGAITRDGTGICVYTHSYGYETTYAASEAGVEKRLKDTVQMAISEYEGVQDVALTHDGMWAVVYGKNSYELSHVYIRGVKNALDEIRESDDTVLSVSMNAAGDYIVLGKKNKITSTTQLTEYGREAESRYGRIISASLSDSGVVFCCEDGVYFHGVHKDVREAIESVEFRPYFVKHTDDGRYLIMGENGGAMWRL